MLFKLLRKPIFEQTYCLFAFVDYNQSLQRESNLVLFCYFNYVTYIKPRPLNPFIA